MKWHDFDGFSWDKWAKFFVILSQRCVLKSNLARLQMAQALKINELSEDQMKINVGRADRMIRVIVGLCILSLAFWGPKSAWAYLGLIPLITGIIGTCPAYQVFGFSTCQTRGQSH